MPVLEDVWNWKQIFPVDSQHYCECGQLVRVLSVEDGPAPGFRCDDGVYRFPNGGTCNDKHRIKIDPSRFKSKAECEKMGMWNRETREETWAKDDAAERAAGIVRIEGSPRRERIRELLKDCVTPPQHPRFGQHAENNTPVFFTSPAGRVDIPDLNDRELENCVAIAFQYWMEQGITPHPPDFETLKINRYEAFRALAWLKLLEVIKPKLVFGKDFHGWMYRETGELLNTLNIWPHENLDPKQIKDYWVRIRLCEGKIEEVRES